jgi:hypothetical protein
MASPYDYRKWGRIINPSRDRDPFPHAGVVQKIQGSESKINPLISTDFLMIFIFDILPLFLMLLHIPDEMWSQVGHSLRSVAKRQGELLPEKWSRHNLSFLAKSLGGEILSMKKSKFTEEQMP